ncbi:hypothetical protein F8G81_04045 [Arthrobacter sp. CDRTa11]|uniref:hypothetical protein n=1 Tax=Arthrobacter sp. CDRTa11 TaxID=2651199 RepID=UPI002265A76B|nr:hypothetical protein [Arthrobacter sp. CDRTa11]UZX01892.1 hypothetical protein F8G81_04045 [Arthrobacter sp. CDRTa11]
MAQDEFRTRLDQVEELYRHLIALREDAKGGHGAGSEELVLAELRLDNAWHELYEFMDLPLSRDVGAAPKPE